MTRKLPQFPRMAPATTPRFGPELVTRASRAKVMGRKGRQALARRRALDGAFLTVAMGVVALLWWSAL